MNLFRATRNEVRNMVGGDRYTEIFADIPLDVCEEDDIKGIYRKARTGEIQGFSGIDDPYEAPDNAEIALGTVRYSTEDKATILLDF